MIYPEWQVVTHYDQISLYRLLRSSYRNYPIAAIYQEETATLTLLEASKMEYHLLIGKVPISQYEDDLRNLGLTPLNGSWSNKFGPTSHPTLTCISLVAYQVAQSITTLFRCSTLSTKIWIITKNPQQSKLAWSI